MESVLRQRARNLQKLILNQPVQIILSIRNVRTVLIRRILKNRANVKNLNLHQEMKRIAQIRRIPCLNLVVNAKVV